jgi:parallel beta-helix repeat protein
VGTTSYPVPSNAVFATAAGTTAGSGTLASPYGSAQTAIDKAPAGATVVLRAGTYHESLFIPRGKKIILQSYPQEAVWLDGSSPVAGWQQSGSTWSVSNWNYNFDHRVSFSAGSDETSSWVDSKYPMAGYPDQVWINGTELSQVGSAAQVTAGKFFVDTTNHKLIIGSDPTGRTVEASTLTQALKIWGVGSVVRGLGVRRYATTVSEFGAVSPQMDSVTLENLVITDNATIGIFFWANGHTFRNLTVSDNGLLGIGGNNAQNFVLEGSRISGNNTERFKREPVSGGVKLTNSSNVAIKRNVIENNLTNGLWFDVSMYNSQIIGNTIKGNGANGFELELSAKAVVADNYISGNGETGIWIFDSGEVDIWNNTLVANARSLSFWSDDRRGKGPSTTIPWITRNVAVHNNVVAFGTDFCPVLTQDLLNQANGNTFVALDANVYQRPSTSSPSRWACWANGTAGIKAYYDMPSFVSGTGMDKRSVGYVGTTPIVDSDYALTSSARSGTASTALPLPAAVAALVDQEAGVQQLGAFGSMTR